MFGYRLSARLTLFALCGICANVAAQSSSALFESDPRAQYFALKRTFDNMFDSGGLRAPGLNPGDRAFDLVDCTGGSEYLLPSGQTNSPRTEIIAKLGDLAYDVVRMRRALKALGYPEAMWKPALIDYEDAQMKMRITERRPQGADWTSPSWTQQQEFKQRLVATLAAYRAREAPTLPKVIYEGGCGAGDFGVKILVEPHSGHVEFIPVFYYELCKAQRLNPDDNVSCDRWREPADGLLFYVAGDYFYVATWPDGSQRRGRLGFNNLQEGQTITIRK